MKFDELIAILKEDCKIENERITENDKLVDDLCMNSLSYMILISSIENRMKISVPINEIRNVKTVGELHNLVNNL